MSMYYPTVSTHHIRNCIKNLVTDNDIRKGVKQSLLSQLKDFILNLLRNDPCDITHDTEFQQAKASIAGAELGILKAILEADLTRIPFCRCDFTVSGQQFTLSAWENNTIIITNAATGDELNLSGVGFSELKRAAIVNTLNRHVHTNCSKIYSITSNADLSYVNLSGLNLAHFDFSRTRLWNTDFSGSNLTHCRFSGANLQRTNFDNASLTHSDFTSATIDNVIFYVSRCAATNFSDSHLTNVEFDGSTVFKEHIYYVNVSKTITNYNNMYLRGFRQNKDDAEVKEKIEIHRKKRVISERNRQFLEPNFTGSTFTKCRFHDFTMINGDLTSTHEWNSSQFTGIELKNCKTSETFNDDFQEYSKRGKKYANRITVTT